MAWTVGGYDSSNMMLKMGDYTSKESFVAMLDGRQQLTSFRGKEESCTLSNIVPKRPFWPFLEDQEDLASEERGNDDSLQQKKKRLTPEQVRSLETSFDKDNKLEPGRKQQLAERLGLEPRQVAVWFQNRRARWKTKQLEHDFSVLKSRYDRVVAEAETLRSEVARLTAELDARVKDSASSAPTQDLTLQVASNEKSPGFAVSRPDCSPESEKAISASPASSDYSYKVNVGSPPEGSPAANDDPEDRLERAIYYHEAANGKVESLAFTYVPSQGCFGSMDDNNVPNQHLAMKTEECLPLEEPYANHVSMDWLWAIN